MAHESGQGVLWASSNAGRYEIGPVGGPDLTTGDVCEVWLGGRWVRAMVCHSRGGTDEAGLMAVEWPHGMYRGYYLLLYDGHGNRSVCGLCTGMVVRLV